jgi:hypothetical protein
MLPLLSKHVSLHEIQFYIFIEVTDLAFCAINSCVYIIVDKLPVQKKEY